MMISRCALTGACRRADSRTSRRRAFQHALAHLFFPGFGYESLVESYSSSFADENRTLVVGAYVTTSVALMNSFSSRRNLQIILPAGVQALTRTFGHVIAL